MTGHRGTIVLCRDSCGAQCTNFGPGSTRSCVVFRFVRSGCVSRDIRLTSLMRGRFHRAYGHASQNIRRTNFLMLGTDTVPDVLIRLKFVSAPRRRQCLGARTKAASLTGNVFHTFLACGHRRRVQLGKDDGAVLPRSMPRPIRRRNGTTATAPRGGGTPRTRDGRTTRHPRESRGTTISRARRDNVIFGVRVLASSHPLTGGSGELGKLGSISCCGRNKVCGCACNTSPSCGGILHDGHDVASGFGSTFVVTFGGKRGVGIGATVDRFGGGEGGWRGVRRRMCCGED